MGIREILIESQTQNDEDGVTISVSRQALTEFIGEFDALQKSLDEQAALLSQKDEALKFYADWKSWRKGGLANIELGTRAKAALSPDPSWLADRNRKLDAAALERIAAFCHVQWCGWMKYLFTKSRFSYDGATHIPPDLTRRWKRQIETPYELLSAPEKESDRKEARGFFAALRAEALPSEGN